MESLYYRDAGIFSNVEDLLSGALLVLLVGGAVFAWADWRIRARKLPQISSTMILGFTFPVEFNRSFVAATAPGPVLSPGDASP